MGRGGTNIGKDVQRFASYIVAVVLVVVFLISIAEDVMTVLGFSNAGAHVESVVRPSASQMESPAENRMLSSDIMDLVFSPGSDSRSQHSALFEAGTSYELMSRTRSRNSLLRGSLQKMP